MSTEIRQQAADTIPDCAGSGEVDHNPMPNGHGRVQAKCWTCGRLFNVRVVRTLAGVKQGPDGVSVVPRHRRAAAEAGSQEKP